MTIDKQNQTNYQNDIEVTVNWNQGLQMQSQIRHFTPIFLDDRHKGQDTAPTPVELFLTSIGSCLLMAFVYCLHLSGVELEPNKLVLKIRGKIIRKQGKLRLTEIRAKFILQKDDQILKIQKCFKKFQPFCILSESIKNGIEFSCSMNYI
ncbi:MAG: OsmC family protein [Candidatus Helarchaeota archaeon]